MKTVRSFVLALVGLIAIVPQSPIAQAQHYPTRPITLIVPWPASGAQDALGRMLGPKERTVFMAAPPRVDSRTEFDRSHSLCTEGARLALTPGCAPDLSLSFFFPLFSRPEGSCGSERRFMLIGL